MGGDNGLTHTLRDGSPLVIGPDTNFLMYMGSALNLLPLVKFGFNPPGDVVEHIDGTVSIYCREFRVTARLRPLEMVSFERHAGPLPRHYSRNQWPSPS